MGASSSLKIHKHLTTSDINSVVIIQQLKTIFNKYKHNSIHITFEQFNLMTSNFLNLQMIKRLFQITSTNPNYINFENFTYLIALFYTSKYTAKLNFLCDLIFANLPQIEKKDYFINVNTYFELSDLLLQIFLDNKLLQNYNSDKSIIQREKVYSFIDNNYHNEINSFILLSLSKRQFNININESSDKKENKDCLITLNLNKKNQKENIFSSKIINIPDSLYTLIENEFHTIEFSNNGLFLISAFERMLEDMEIIQSVIYVISNYLRIKTQKSYFNFNTFKDLLKCIHNTENKNEYECLFDIMSYPNNYITKSNMFIFLKETNPSLSSDTINKYFNEEMKNNSTLNKNSFVNVITKFLLSEQNFITSMEIIQYLPFLKFKLKPTNKNIENKCIQVLFSNKSFDEYIKDRLSKEYEFYIIDYQFWEQWNSNVPPQSNNENKKLLKINTSRICNMHGGLLEGLRYMSDYILITEKMHSYFSMWYGFQIGPILKRQKILLNDKTVLGIDNDDSEDDETVTTNTKEKYNNNPLLKGIDFASKQQFEIEIYPLLLLFFSFDELVKNHKTLDKIKDFLKQNSNPKTSKSNYCIFSRQTKISTLLDQLEKTLNKVFEQDKVRMWLYYQNNFEIISTKGTLENKGIVSSAIFVVEIFENDKWPIDTIDSVNKLNNSTRTSIEKPKRSKKPKSIKYDPQLVGLVNLGSTCYMNSILQMFLNNEDIQQILLSDSDNKDNAMTTKTSFTQSQNNYSINNELLSFLCNKITKGLLIKELLNLIIMKYKGNSKSLKPQKFKEICGQYNGDFKGNDQQDAHDFLGFLIEALHEEINIKVNKTRLETINENNLDNNQEKLNLLSDQHWAYNIINNASYIHSLFLGQLQSTLTCSKCHKSRISYETFSSLSLPIPENSKIVINVLLFRLPFTLKAYYDSITNKLLSIDSSNLRKSLLNIKSTIINRIYSSHKENDTESLDEVTKNDNEKQNELQYNTLYFNKQKQNNNLFFNTNEVIHSNYLNINVPLNIQIEIDKKEKCENIIKKIKELTDLELETTNQYTSYILVNNGKYINDQLLIEECFIEGNLCSVYELLNYNGIEKLFKYNSEKYKDKIETNVNKLEKNYGELMTANPITKANFCTHINWNELRNVALQGNGLSNKLITVFGNNYEIIIPIIQRYDIKDDKFILFGLEKYEYLNGFQDFILLPNKTKCFRNKDLYNIIWEKYEYFVDIPSKVQQSLWWNDKVQTSQSPKDRSPFVLKILNKRTKCCYLCPWFKFCTGCVLEVNNVKDIEFTYEMILCVEWSKEIYLNNIKNGNINRTFNYNNPTINLLQPSQNTEKQKELTLLDCFDLFMKKEELDNVYCETCKSHTTLKKHYEISRYPKYFIITLKRFKFTAFFRQKIYSLIKFPLTDLDLSTYTCKYLNFHPLYDLYAIVNHSGILTHGHYYSIIKQNDKWIKYDDETASEFKTALETQNVYILMYKMKTKPTDKIYFNYFGLLETAFLLYKNNDYSQWDSLFNFEFDADKNKYKEINGVCKYYYGEPISIKNKGRGILLDIINDNGLSFAKVKLDNNENIFDNKNGIELVKLEDIIKETLKSDFEEENLKELTKKIDLSGINNHQDKKEKLNCECILF